MRSEAQQRIFSRFPLPPFESDWGRGSDYILTGLQVVFKYSSTETSESFIFGEFLRPSEKMAMSKGVRVGTITIGCSLLVLTFISMRCGIVAMRKMRTPIAVSIGLWGLYVSITFHSVFSLTFAFVSN
jgi:hypothetical protein